MQFQVNDKVTTPIGTGQVVYAETDYIEVEVGDTEHGFHYPFQFVTAYVDEAAIKVEKVTAQEIAAKLAFGNIPDKMVFDGKLMHRIGAAAVFSVGGSADSWAKLTYLQRINFIAVASGSLAEVLISKYTAEELINS